MFLSTLLDTHRDDVSHQAPPDVVKMLGQQTATSLASSQWLTVEDLLRELGVPRSTWEKWRQRGVAPRSIKLPNGQLRIRREWVDEWLTSLFEVR